MKLFRMMTRAWLIGVVLAGTPFQNVAASLGEYVTCEVDNFTISEATVADAGPLGTANLITGTGSGRCSQDFGGLSGWVSSTFSFTGKIVNDACVLSTDVGVHTAKGTFGLSDGSPRGTVPATLKVVAKPIDTWRRAIDLSLELEGTPLVTSFRIVDANPSLELDKRPQLCPTSVVLPSCDSVTYFNLPDNPYVDNFNVPVGLPGVSGCRDWIQVAGDIEAVHPSEDTEGALDDSSALLEALNLTNTETGVEELLPEDFRLGLGGRDLGVAIDVDTQLALEQMLVSLSGMFAISPTVSPQLAMPTGPLPFTIKVKYQTPVGYQTITQVGAPGVPNTVLVPNLNNSSIPEPVLVTLTTVAGANSGDADYTLTVERTITGTCRELRADVSVIEPLQEAAAVVGSLASLGFETLDIPSGAMPKKFEFKLSRSSTDSQKNSAVSQNIKPACGTFKDLDLVAQYQVSGEVTNLLVRVPMRPAVSNLDIIATNVEKGFRLNYMASGFVNGIFLSGTRAGTPVDLSLANLPYRIDLCTESGPGCATPWRATVESCKFVGFVAGRPQFACKTVPRALDTTAWFTSRVGANAWPVTLNAKFYGTGSSTPNMKVTNLAFSDIAFDARTSGYPKHAYWDTRSQSISGKVEVPGKMNFTANFWARDRQFVLNKVKWYQGTFGYKVSTSGKMHCNAGFDLDIDGVPGWVDNWIEGYLCN